MPRTSLCRLLSLSLPSALVLLSASFAYAQWTAPTPEELSMTSQPQVPGAAAVYLYREETTDDKLRMFSFYARIKVLTERGKKFDTIELPSFSGSGFTSVDVQGRTVHADGTIVPFTGKPHEALIERSQGAKLTATVFTLPDVEVGSIIEYRYKIHYSYSVLRSPQWDIQSALWTRKAYYVWRAIGLAGKVVPTDAKGNRIDTIFWTQTLPDGAEVKQTKVLVSPTEIQNLIELNLHDIPPAPQEANMPPVSRFTYRVLFYYSSYHSSEEFWLEEGKHWAAEKDKIIGPSSGVIAATRNLVSASDTQDQKLRKIYAAVMQLDNMSFDSPHSSAENMQGPKDVHNTDDILARKRGTNEQLTELFVAMARAAGMKAYFASVTNRNNSLFIKELLTFSQLTGHLAIVEVDGKERFFDPGARYCPYGHLVWQHTETSGIRQMNGGAEFVQTPSETYDFSRTQRIANLTINDQGNVAGMIKMTYMGYPNLGWRQSGLREGNDALEQALQSNVQRLMPPSIEVKVTSIEKLDDYEQPLVVNLEVKGSLGSSTGKRRLILGDIFETNTKPAFPNEKRDTPVYFQYSRVTQDAVLVHFPSTFTVEALPGNMQTTFQKFAAYDIATESTATSFTVHRNYALAKIIFQASEYADLRTFYSKMENKDQETVVLTTAAAKAAQTGN